MTPYVSKRQERRTCYDRTRMHWLRARRAQAANPAASAALRLLAIFGFLFRQMPVAAPMPVRYVAPPVSPKQAQRIEAARHLGIPTRYLDIVLHKGKVPYVLLSEHIRLGGATRRDALEELRKRIPAEALDWLDHVEKRALWSDLGLCFHKGDGEEDTNIRFLQATLAWVERHRKPGDCSSGPAETDRGLKPNTNYEIVPPDDHTCKPRP